MVSLLARSQLMKLLVKNVVISLIFSLAVVTQIWLISNCIAKKSVGGGGRGLQTVKAGYFLCVHHPDSDKFINIIKCISWQCSEASYSLEGNQSSEDVLAFNGTLFYSWLVQWISELLKTNVYHSLMPRRIKRHVTISKQLVLKTPSMWFSVNRFWQR